MVSLPLPLAHSNPFLEPTSCYLTMRVQFLAQWNNVSLWWESNLSLTSIHRLQVRRPTKCPTLPLILILNYITNLPSVMEEHFKALTCTQHVSLIDNYTRSIKKRYRQNIKTVLWSLKAFYALAFLNSSLKVLLHYCLHQTSEASISGLYLNSKILMHIGACRQYNKSNNQLEI